MSGEDIFDHATREQFYKLEVEKICRLLYTVRTIYVYWPDQEGCSTHRSSIFRSEAAKVDKQTSSKRRKEVILLQPTGMAALAPHFFPSQ